MTSNSSTQMMEIEIKFGKGKTDHVSVHFGDDPQKLAEDFVRKHRLKAQSVTVIKQYIDSTIEEFLVSQQTESESSKSLSESITTATASQQDEPVYPPTTNRGSDKSNKRPIEEKPIEATASVPIVPVPAVPAPVAAPAPSLASLFPRDHSNSQNTTHTVSSMGSDYSHSSLPPPYPTTRHVSRSEATPIAVESDRATGASNGVAAATISVTRQSSYNQYSQPIYPHSRSPSTDLNGSGPFVPIPATQPPLPRPPNSNNSNPQTPHPPSLHDPHSNLSTPYSPSPYPPVLLRDQRSNSLFRSSNSNNEELHDTDEVMSQSIERCLSGISTRGRQNSRFEREELLDAGMGFAGGVGIGMDGEEEGSGVAALLNEHDEHDDASIRGYFSASNSVRGYGRYGTNTPSNLPLGNNSNNHRTTTPIAISAYATEDDSEVEDDATIEQQPAVELSPEQEAELKYNQLKTMSFASVQQHQNPNKSMNLTPASKTLTMNKTSSIIGTGIKKLPSNNSINLNNPFASINRNKIVGKTVNERLYQSAEIIKKKKEYSEASAKAKMEKQLVEDQYKLNPQSRRIMTSVQSKASHNSNTSSSAASNNNNDNNNNQQDIGLKLYQEGKKKQAKQQLIADKQREYEESGQKDAETETWSCAKCGTFYKRNTPSFTSLLLHSNNSTNNSVASGTEGQMMMNGMKEEDYTCKQCGWKQTNQSLFTPLNIGLTFNNTINKELTQSRKHALEQQGANATVHDYLYEVGKQQAQILNLNKILWDELTNKLSFVPSISNGSQLIIDRYRRQGKWTEKESIPEENGPGLVPSNNKSEEEDLVSLSVASSTSTMTGLTQPKQTNDNNAQVPKTQSAAMMLQARRKISGPIMKDYLRKPVVERLVALSNAGNCSSAQSVATEGEESQFTSQTMNRQSQEELNKRLMNENREKGARLAEKSAYFATHDSVTGQPFFHPKVKTTLPEEIYHNGVNIAVQQSGRFEGKSKDIWADILRRDEEMIRVKLQRQKQAIDKQLVEITSNQIKALPKSTELLQRSNEKQLSELFQLLLINSWSFEQWQDMLEAQMEAENILSDELLDGNEAEEEMKSNVNASKAMNCSMFVEDGSIAAGSHHTTSTLQSQLLANHPEYKRYLNPHKAIDVNGILPAGTAASIGTLDELDIVRDDWASQKLDLMKINVDIMINEVSTMLLDMKHLKYQQVMQAIQQQEQALKPKQKTTITSQSSSSNKSNKPSSSSSKMTSTSSAKLANNSSNKASKASASDLSGSNEVDDRAPMIVSSPPTDLLVSYEEFKSLASQCMKQRSGPGKGYISAPKKKPDVAIQMKLQQYAEETFRPDIDPGSLSLASRHRHSQLRQDAISIEDILLTDGAMMKDKIELLRQQKILAESEQLTFKPTLIKPPSYITPRYRGMEILEEEDEDEISTIGGMESSEYDWKGVNAATGNAAYPTGNERANGGVAAQQSYAKSVNNVTSVLSNYGIAWNNNQTVIRGGGSSNNTSITQPQQPSQQPNNANNLDVRTSFSSSDEVIISKDGKVLLTPPHVRQSRLLRYEPSS